MKSCISYWILCFLLSTISIIEKSTIGEVRVLKERLELVRQKWLTIGISFTPKVNLFLDYVVDQIHEIKGYTTTVEDSIEREHQKRH